jgi:N-acetylglucosaminyldiphosphoundecaprenol N-acetyl-beta-D-mannosaminyltransferase
MPEPRKVGVAPAVGDVNILGVEVSALTRRELHEHIATAVREGDRSLVLNVNAHGLNLAYRQAWLRDLLNRADLVFPDGYGVILAARILGRALPERITYADWMWQLAEFCHSRDLSLYLLGARPGVAEAAADQLVGRWPGLVVSGTQHGYFDKRHGSDENQAVVEAINRARPHLLVVAFGMPVQERWLLENWEAIQANVALTGGAAFDYVSGHLRRPPRLLTDRGLEWLGRLAIEPRRLWRRYLLGNPLFLWRVLRQRVGGLPAGLRTSDPS